MQDWEDQLQSDTRDRPALDEQESQFLVPGLTILDHPDVRRVGEKTHLTELCSGQEAVLSRIAPLFAAPGRVERRPLIDPYISRRPLRFQPGADGAVRLLAGGTSQRVEIDGEPVETERTIPAEELDEGVVVLLADRLVLLLHLLDPTPPSGLPDCGLVGESRGLLSLRQEIRRAAGLDVPLLLCGETGTGKELVAEAIHRLSHRQRGPYLCINMAGIPIPLAAAELFGAEKGAYTGASRRRSGFFGRADGGTLFLDEVGEMPLEVQSLLLRTLETGEIQAVGDEEPRKCDVRIIAATDSDLEGSIREGRFRAPLLHRLSGYRIDLPPLRDRRDDFGRLFFFFLGQELERLGRYDLMAPGGDHGRRTFPPPALIARMARHRWPGNVRQVRNIARQVAIAGSDVTAADLEQKILHLLRMNDAEPEPGDEPRKQRVRSGSEYRKPNEVSESELVASLRAHRWLLQPTAADLGVSRTSLYALIARSPGIRRATDLEPGEITTCYESSGGDLEAMVDHLEVSRPALERRLRELGLL